MNADVIARTPVTLKSCLAALLFCIVSSAAAVPLYSLTDLGDLPGEADYSIAHGLNDQGQVVGRSYTIGGYRAFLWEDGAMTPLAGIPGMQTSRAEDVNNSGLICGSYYGGGLRHAVVWQDGEPIELGDLSGGSGFSAAYAVNNLGQVVGYAGHPFCWQDGTMTDLGLLPGASSGYARGINDASQVVGYCRVGGDDRAFLWQDGVMTDLGMLGSYEESEAWGINSVGQVVGRSFTGYDERPFLWDAGEMISLGVLPEGTWGRAYGINSRGEVVGLSDRASGQGAFVWTAAAGMRALDDLLDASGEGWILNAAYGINENGQIVGSGATPDGQPHGFLLTPIPEPAPLALFVVGAYAISRRRKATRVLNANRVQE